MTTPSIWVVDDDDSIRWVLNKAIQRLGANARCFESADAMLAELPSANPTPALLLTDLRMPGQNGLDLLAALQQRPNPPPVILMTAYADAESAARAFQLGAFDYQPKPFELDDALRLMQRALQPATTAPATPAPGPSAKLLGRSSAMQQIFRAIGKLAHSHSPVLITGETGTGKERVAQALHQLGSRQHGPFVAINAAALPRDLLEAELFGHERGAFTGAQQQHLGRFEQARGGTLLLDEIGDMPLELQTRLLRVLAEGQFYRVGGRQAIQCDVRIIAATHQPLEQWVAEGRFRADLFHRLNVSRLHLPPLRERPDDIAELAEHFLQQAAHQHQQPAKQLSPAALQELQQHAFPGNVRELANLRHHLSLFTPGEQILPADLNRQTESAAPLTATSSGNWADALTAETLALLRAGQPTPYHALRERFEASVINAALQHTGGKRAQAAELLGIGRNTLSRRRAD
jgi:two-component system nitrogen regulation response regulator GlnG